jgi:hypothetical protein
VTTHDKLLLQGSDARRDFGEPSARAASACSESCMSYSVSANQGPGRRDRLGGFPFATVPLATWRRAQLRLCRSRGAPVLPALLASFPRGGAYRRWRDLSAFPLLVTVFMTGIASEAEGNLGSAFRHRDQPFWAVAFFATLGVHHIFVPWQPSRGTAGQTHEEREG